MFVGVSSVFGIVESFGCVTAVATTTARKAATMLISFLVFPKPFTIMYIDPSAYRAVCHTPLMKVQTHFSSRYLYGSVLFIAGIVCSTVSKQPGVCPRVATLLRRFHCLKRAASRELGDHMDVLTEKDAMAVEA
jgi:hypothetical protein